MKLTYYRNTLIAVTAFISLINTSVSSADGPFSSGLGAGNVNFAPTDVYIITCPVTTSTVRATLTNPNGSNVDQITVQVLRPAPANNLAINHRARSVIATEGLSPRSVVLAVNPLQNVRERYFVSVHKDSTLLALALPYKLSLDCYNAAGSALPGNQTVMVQNF